MFLFSQAFAYILHRLPYEWRTSNSQYVIAKALFLTLAAACS